MTSPFASILTPTLLQSLADDRSYERGERYFDQGRVQSLVEHEGVIAAKVQGTETYEVEFWLEDEAGDELSDEWGDDLDEAVELGELQLGYECDCPVGEDGLFCKHCVAVGLAWIDRPPVLTKPKKPSAAKSSSKSSSKAASKSSSKAASKSSEKSSEKSSPPTMEDVRRYLEALDSAALVQLILDRADKDENWQEVLLLKIVATRPQALDLKTYKRKLDEAIAVGGYIDYYETSSYVSEVEEAIDFLDELLAEGLADAVVELCEYAVKLIERAYGAVDDSDGSLGYVMERVQNLHHAACEQAKPEPIALAGRLFELEWGSNYESFSEAAGRYAEILGQPGLNHYRDLAERAWKALPAPATTDRYSSESYKQRKLQGILETLARQTGDIEAVVAIKTRDLSESYTYLQIAELYQQAHQPEKALKWAEDGLKAFPDRPSPHLRDFVIAIYQQRGRFDEAMQLVWSTWTESLQLHTYERLKTEADRGNQWPVWRERAIAHIREKIQPDKQSSPSQPTRHTPYRTNPYSPRLLDHSLLVQIFLWEGDPEAAWQEAQTGGCSQDLWLKLADKRQADHPEDALSIYLAQIEPLVQLTNNDAYARATKFLKQVRSLMLRLGLQSQYDQYVAHLRANYKAKRNFMKLLSQEKL